MNNLEKRIDELEKKTNIKRRCGVIILLYDDQEGPSKEEIEQFRERRKKGGHCENCDGSCVLDWTEKASGG